MLMDQFWVLVSCYPSFFSSAALSSGYPRVSHRRPALPWSVPPVILSVFSVFVGSLSVSIHLPSLWHLLNVGVCFSTFFSHFLHYYLQRFICLSLQFGSKLGLSVLQNAQQWPSFLWISKKVCILGVLNQFAKSSATELLMLLYRWLRLSAFLCICFNIQICPY